MSALERLPAHLRKYIVEQDYDRYTPEDQAVWRFVMRQLKDYLSRHAHECYVQGLEKTGISIETIPRIEHVDKMLEAFGWGAIPVSGFIPPAAFMEFQSLGILPIASDMRTLDHLQYTPAPDIVHEAAGHAPILIHSEFAEYLRKYASVARHAIISKEDMDQYNAIRTLSDLKENPKSSDEEIRKAEADLAQINANMKHVSEAALLSRMNWWTAEYGLIGDLSAPKIYGAGLLSSVGESRDCLSGRVKKIPLTVDCVDVSYDITEPQPQLFVVNDFKTLHTVLDQLAEKLSFRRGGVYGLQQALNAETINTVQLNSGIQISGVLETFWQSDQGEPTFIKLRGACQLCVENAELPGQGIARHPHGFSSPVGKLKAARKGLSEFSKEDLQKGSIRIGEPVRFEYESGIVVEGMVKNLISGRHHLQVISLNPCKVTRGSEVLFDPSWGEFDLAVGENVVSVFGGPADRAHYGDTDSFDIQTVPRRNPDSASLKRFQVYAEIRECRMTRNLAAWSRLTDAYLNEPSAPWLQGLELLEIGYSLKENSNPKMDLLKAKLDPHQCDDPSIRKSIEDGLKLATRSQ